MSDGRASHFGGPNLRATIDLDSVSPNSGCRDQRLFEWLAKAFQPD